MQSRSGELAMRPLPAVLLDLHEDIVTGRLTLRRGRVSKHVDLVNGNPVSTASTPRDETLGHFLVTSGVISEEQHRSAVERAATVGGKLGEALVALRALTVEQLIDQLGRQSRHKIVQALRWPQGAWRFEPGQQAAEGLQLRMLDVVLGGLRETAVEDLGRLSRLDGMSFELTERGKRLRHELKKTFGERALAILGAGGPVGEVEKAIGDRVQARIAIDALLMCDALVAKGAQLGMGADATTTPLHTQTLLGVAPVRDDDPPEGEEGAELYDMLFDEQSTDVRDIPTELGSAELEPVEYGELVEIHDDDSGVVSSESLQKGQEQRAKVIAARQAITAEHQRVQGADHYAVLLIERDADADDIEAAYELKLAMLDKRTAGVTDPQDRQKLEQITTAYATARGILLDATKRRDYNRELAGGELVQVPPAIDTELNFRMAEELIRKKVWPQAILLLKKVVNRSPGEADYHAALGWAMFCQTQTQQEEGQTTAPEGALAALDELNTALSINPDHPAAHEYKGRVDAVLRVDDAGAIFHLERALDLDPSRVEAIATIEQLMISRGELRRLERILKRLLFRLRGTAGAAEVSGWVRLARLYIEHLDDRQAGVAAIGNAKKLAPRDPELLQLEAKVAPSRRPNATDPPRAGWREALADADSGAALVDRTVSAGHVDAAFLAASTMVALGTADDKMGALYDTQRPRTLVLPTKPLTREQWKLVRHRDDNAELGTLLEIVAPAIQTVAPMTLADSDLDAGQRVAETDLPGVFAKVRGQLGALLGVGAATPIYAKSELGYQIHVVACDPPVLAAGDEALTAPERPDLVFRLSRAMTFLWPGRAVGASRPGRVLKAVVLAVVREAAGNDLGKGEPLADRAEEALARLSPDARSQARATALRILSRAGGGLNLSAWARSLSRTADRIGLLLAADIPAAFAGAKDMGELDKDLVDFAFSAPHVTLRRELGLSRG